LRQLQWRQFQWRQHLCRASPVAMAAVEAAAAVMAPVELAQWRQWQWIWQQWRWQKQQHGKGILAEKDRIGNSKSNFKNQGMPNKQQHCAKMVAACAIAVATWRASPSTANEEWRIY